MGLCNQLTHIVSNASDYRTSIYLSADTGYKGVDDVNLHHLPRDA